MTDSTARGAKAPGRAPAQAPGKAPGASGKAPGSSGKAPGRPPAKSPGRPSGTSPADRGMEDTVVRPKMKDRISHRLANAAQEHRDTANMTPASAQKKQPRRARLKLTRIDPWSVMKASFLLSIAFGLVTFVAVFIVWSVLGAAGVWDSINATVATALEGDTPSDFDVADYIGTSRVLGFTALVSVLNVILLTAMATLSAFLYNMAAALLGGVEVTLSEER